jgi:hypothetical protein
MQEKLRVVGKEEGIKGLGRKETKSGMDRNGKLEKGSPTTLCSDYTHHSTLGAPPKSALVALTCRL